MIVGFTPFLRKKQSTMYDVIKNSDVVFPDPDKHKIPMSSAVKDLIKKVTDLTPLILQLLSKDAAKRLGTVGGAEDIKAHEWFKDIDFEKLEQKLIPAPFVPELSNDEFDITNFEVELANEDAKSPLPHYKLQLVKEFSKGFEGFNC